MSLTLTDLLHQTSVMCPAREEEEEEVSAEAEAGHDRTEQDGTSSPTTRDTRVDHAALPSASLAKQLTWSWIWPSRICVSIISEF